MKRKKTKIIIIISVIVALLVTGIILTKTVIMPHIQHKRMVKYYEDKIAVFEKENKDIEPHSIDIVFLGDSITDMCDLSKFYPQYTTLNRGIGGDTTHGLLKRLKVSVYDVKPKVCVMLIGTNNLDTMFDDYEDILKGFEKNIPDTEIILVSITPMGGEFKERNYIAAYNNIKIKTLAQKYGYHYVDAFSLLLNQQTDEIYPKYTIDNLHLSDEGYKAIASVVNKRIEEILK